MNGGHPATKALDLVPIYVYAAYFMANIAKTKTGRKTNVSRSYDADSHTVLLIDKSAEGVVSS